MSNKPVLVIMAAGMGSRYGGLKQLDPVGNHGQLIIDYSIYDAKRAGFETVVFVIKPEIEADFKEAIGDRVSKVMDVKYAYQLKEDLPEGYSVPAGRTKPWGTAPAAAPWPGGCARRRPTTSSPKSPSAPRLRRASPPGTPRTTGPPGPTCPPTPSCP